MRFGLYGFLGVLEKALLVDDDDDEEEVLPPPKNQA